MRRLLGACLLLAAALPLLVPLRVCAQGEGDGLELVPIPELRDLTRAARLRTALDGSDPDTVWIGHIHDPAFTAGGTMPPGGYGPYKVGRGPNRPTRGGSPLTVGSNGVWDFDRFQPDETDSLQGWWPIGRPYQTSRTTEEDWKRPFFGLDYGNNVNYVINQGSPKRTFGVVGLWHRDRGNTVVYAPSDSIPETNVQPVLWSPTEVGGPGSTASAWCGLRSHGDLSHVDALAHGGTGNPFNAALLQYQGNNGFFGSGSEGLGLGSASPLGTDHNFPGYASQLDQMLYRDVALGEGDGLTLSFNFSTNMSTAKQTASRTRIGWFDKDPVSNAMVAGLPTSDGNFISSTVAGANAPCDSFMVYVGAPVYDGNVTFSAPLMVGGSEVTTVYDPRRRWFSEVLKLGGRCSSGSTCSIIGKQILSVAGVKPPTAVSLDFGALYPAALQAIKDADGVTGNGGVVRIVFRVKTNRGWDDENAGNPEAAFDSGTRGAAIVDNVVVNGWAASEGDFEAADAINNDPAVSPLTAWKSTGKPPAAYWHVHDVSPTDPQPLAYNDPCGGLDSPYRTCNLYGKVATPGDHDNAERPSGPFGINASSRSMWFVSPTINLRSSGNGPGFYNAMGIDDEIARTTGDYIAVYSLYNAGFFNATIETGQFWQVGWQSYPARQPNGNIQWGETRHVRGISFYGFRACLEVGNFTPAKANGLIVTTSPDNKPDSLRVYIHRVAMCFSGPFGLVCAPPTGDVGTYYDNISVALIDTPPPAALSIDFWHLINDAFPANGNPALIPAGFDTCAAQVRTGYNIATGTPRPSVTGDSVVVAAPGADQRLDMVFRILPGVGNYLTLGSKASGVAKRPDVIQRVLATPGDGTFFGEYMANAGEFASHANHLGQGPGGTNWSQHIWNSARMDTVEYNLFPTATNAGAVGLVDGRYRTTYHEADPKFATLGILKSICVMPSPAGPANSTNMACDGTGWGAYGALSGWDGVVTTKEHTKIIPDGLLTPGAHVQYFFRKSQLANPAAFAMAPDTSVIFQPAEGSVDGHRWQQFGVLPDRWKDGLWSDADRHASAPACMLFVDWCDRRGDERVWVGIADTLGATAAARRGAHNGWRARGDQDLTGTVATDPSIAVYTHGGQPGALWDMFGVKGAGLTTTSSLGSRLAEAPTGLVAGMQTLTGPSGDMVRHYYRILLALTGDLGANLLGPYPDKTDNDVGLLQDFAYTVGGTARPRLIWFQGQNFVEGQFTGGASAHVDWVRNYFGADLRSGNYRTSALNQGDIVDLVPNPPTVTSGAIYGLLNDCRTANDVLSPFGTFGATMAAKYPDTGTGANPKIASIYAGSTLPNAAHPMITLVDGFRISSLGSRNTLQSPGRLDYYHQVITNLFGSLNCLLAGGGPVAVGENPNPTPVYYLALGSANPVRDGMARITFGLAQADKVELRVYDVAGRLVRTLAHRVFPAGEHELLWDGTGEDGQRVARGVYFYQLRTPSFVSQRKLAVLKR